jgi:Icc-related predicted phosphoesterase
MRKFFISFILFTITVSCAVKVNAQNSEPVSARIKCGPWLQAVGENEFTIVWLTNVNAISWVEIAPDDGSHFYAFSRPKYYESVYGRRPVTTLHTVRITGLEKGTSYRYRIYQQALLADEGNKRMVFGEGFGNDILRHSPYKLTTLDESASECRFSMVNDIHGNDSIFRKLMSNTVKSGNDFVIFNGDMLTQIESREQLIEGYMKSASEFFSGNIPIFAVRGNHEHRGSASYDYMKLFPTSTGQPYYTFRHGPAFFIAMECGEDKPDDDIRYYGLSLTDRLREEQALWLKKVLASEEFKSAPVKIVILHMPPGRNGIKDWHGRREITRLYMPLLNEAGIDMMLSGHLHRNIYIEKGEGGNNFPILINSNTTRVDVQVTPTGIDMSVVDGSGKILHTHNIGK